MVAWLPAAITAAASIGSSYLGSKASDRASQAHAENVAATNAQTRKQWNRGFKWQRQDALRTRAFNRSEAAKARAWSSDQARIDRDMQREFAQKSAGWQFDDLMEAADEAGIHRMAALGASGGATYSPAAGGGAAAAGSAGAAPSPGFFETPEVSIGGSIVGDGMNALADFARSEFARRAEAAGAQKDEARQDAILRSELDRNSAETEMFRAQAARILMDARSPAAGNLADPDPTTRQEPYASVYNTPFGKVTVPVGADPGEIAAGLGIAATAAVRKHGQEHRSEVREQNKSRRQTSTGRRQQ